MHLPDLLTDVRRELRELCELRAEGAEREAEVRRRRGGSRFALREIAKQHIPPRAFQVRRPRG